MTYDDIKLVIDTIEKYIKTNDTDLLIPIQGLMKKVAEIDYKIKTHEDYDKNKFVKDSHGPARLLVMLINYFGEHYLEGGTLTIYNDDPKFSKASHTNQYIIKFKDDSHDQLTAGNPTGKDWPYDFNTVFVSQQTIYSDGNSVDTTAHPWDSFHRVYNKPYRTIDFKSALWKSKHTHFVDYIMQLDFKGKLHIITNDSDSEEKIFNFIPAANTEEYYNNYLIYLNKVGLFKKLSWEDFMLN